MEQRIENFIDNILESISSQLYIFSVGFGIVIITLGIILFFSRKSSKEKMSKTKASLVCIVIGIVAIVSGLIQMF